MTPQKENFKHAVYSSDTIVFSRKYEKLKNKHKINES